MNITFATAVKFAVQILPALAVRVVPERHEVATTIPMPKPPVEILWVEDFEPDMILLRRLLQRNGVTTPLHVVGDGEEALDFLFRRGAYEHRAATLPSVVFLDTRLPKLNGWEVLRELKQFSLTKDLPVIVTSGLRLETEEKAFRDLGATGFLHKPFGFYELQQALLRTGFILPVAKHVEQVA